LILGIPIGIHRIQFSRRGLVKLFHLNSFAQCSGCAVKMAIGPGSTNYCKDLSLPNDVVVPREFLRDRLARGLVVDEEREIDMV
jgi:hypothetical protein